MMKLIPYSFDILNRHCCIGWCYNRLLKSRPVTISFYRGDRLIGSVRCDDFRRDLLGLKLHPTGLCGFSIEFEPTPAKYDQEPLIVRVNGYPFPLHVVPASHIVVSIDHLAKTFFFMHIPKTAGTSFNNFMLPRFNQVQTAIHIESLELNQQKALAQRHYVSGHLTLCQIREIYGDLDQIDLHTILRQPYQQLHSHLAWVKAIADQKAISLFSDHTTRVQNLSLKLNGLDLRKHDELKQLVTGLKGFELEFFDNLQTRYFLDYQVERVTQSDLDCALNNTIQFRTIGFTEEFAPYTRKICAIYNLGFTDQNTSYNATNIKPLFDLNDHTVKEILQPLVQFDLALYQSIQQTSQHGQDSSPKQ